MRSISKFQSSQEQTSNDFREQIFKFGKSSDYLLENLKNRVNRYFLAILSINFFFGAIFLLGGYFFQYREIKENIKIIKSILHGEEKYWWDKENKILFLKRNEAKK